MNKLKVLGVTLIRAISWIPVRGLGREVKSVKYVIYITRASCNWSVR